MARALDIIHLYLDKVAKKMKKWANKKRWHIEYWVGDLVLVKLLPQLFKSLMLVYKGLLRIYKGPSPIVGRVGQVSYKVELLPRLKIHHVFYVRYLKLYHEDMDGPSLRLSKRAPTTIMTFYNKEVELIIMDRVIKRQSMSLAMGYLFKWKRLPESEAS